MMDNLLATISEISKNNPPALIKKDCSMLLAKAKNEFVNDLSIQNPMEIEHQKKKTMKCIELKEEIEKEELSEEDS